MSLLTLVQTFCLRSGVPSPSYVQGTSDTQVLQMNSLLNEVLEDLVARFDWQELVKEATFTTVAGADQGPVTSIAAEGFKRILNDTIFNRTMRLPLYGPLSAQEWQALRALPTIGPFYKFRIRGGRLLFDPTAPEGHLCAFEYFSKWAVIDGDDSSAKPTFVKDSDTCALDEDLLQAGLRWKWKAEKGLDYAEELQRYEIMVNNAFGIDGSRPVVSMDGGSSDFRPGVWVPAGNWNLP